MNSLAQLVKSWTGPVTTRLGLVALEDCTTIPPALSIAEALGRGFPIRLQGLPGQSWTGWIEGINGLSSTTRDALLAEAQKLIRTRGYAAFSYAHLADVVKIRKASIHHYFPTKADLGNALLEGHLNDLSTLLGKINQSDAAVIEKIETFAAGFSQSLSDDALPLCCAVSAQYEAIPDSMKELARIIFELQLSWLKEMVEAGIEDGTFRKDVDPEQAAHLILSVLEGASIINWVVDRKKPIGELFASAINPLRN